MNPLHVKLVDTDAMWPTVVGADLRAELISQRLLRPDHITPTRTPADLKLDRLAALTIREESLLRY